MLALLHLMQPRRLSDTGTERGPCSRHLVARFPGACGSTRSLVRCGLASPARVADATERPRQAFGIAHPQCPEHSFERTADPPPLASELLFDLALKSCADVDIVLLSAHTR